MRVFKFVLVAGALACGLAAFLELATLARAMGIVVVTSSTTLMLFHAVRAVEETRLRDRRYKYPRDRYQREQHLDALRVMWPKIQELSPSDRVVLLQMARSCHLQDAESPVAIETVLGCLRYGAKVLNATKELDRLLISTRLPGPLTAAP